MSSLIPNHHSDLLVNAEFGVLVPEALLAGVGGTTADGGAEILGGPAMDVGAGGKEEENGGCGPPGGIPPRGPGGGG